MNSARVLCVDDEPQVLQGLERILFDDFEVETASSGEEGLKLLRRETFEVVISDMRMPRMNGAQFLSQVNQTSPGSIRMLLTGQSDIQSAASAVNEGGIFRFLIKPCPPDVLKKAIQQATEQYRLQRIEHDLLENTLGGAIESLMRLLDLTCTNVGDDAAFLRDVSVIFARARGNADPWRCETTAMLWHMSYAVLPEHVIAHMREGDLSAEESKMSRAALHTAASLVESIPRLEDVAALIRALADGPQSRPGSELAGDLEALQLARKYVAAVHRGAPPARAVVEVLPTASSSLREQLVALEPPRVGSNVNSVDVTGLTAGTFLHADVVSKKGVTVARAGHRLTAPLIQKLKNFHDSMGLELPILVVDEASAAKDS
ncbi:MAG: response regulator [Myxococcota bacterium]